MLICPVCGVSLREEERAFRCDGGHSFDRAREGYVDLLPAGHGRSRRRGDTAEMLRARRRFLERGHFSPLTDALAGLAVERAGRAAATVRRFVLLDAGCGEAHHTGRIGRALAVATGVGDLVVLGLDLSRDAVRLAARSVPEGLFFVNDVSHRICVKDGGVDLLLDIFAPRNGAEFERVLAPGGLLVVVIPTPGHLAELREAYPLLGMEADKRERVMDALGPGLVAEWERAIEYPVRLAGDEAAELIRMSPSRHHLDEGALTAVAAAGAVDVTLGFHVLGFVRRDEGRLRRGAGR